MDGLESWGVVWPAWVSGTLILGASIAAAWVASRLGVAIASRRFRKSGGEPWVERARLALAPRQVVAGNSLLLPLAIGAVVGFRVAPDLGLSPRIWGVLAGIVALVAVQWVGLGLERRVCGTRGGVTLAMLLVPPALIPLALMLALVPDHWGWVAAAVLALGAALTTVNVCGGWLVPLRRLGLAWPASPRLRAVVDRAAGRMGVRPRATFELDSPQSNALAWPVPKLLVFFGPILEGIDDDGLATIAAHELGHLDEPWSAYLVRLIAAYFPVACAAALPLTGSFGPAVGLAPFAVMLVGVIVAQRVGRRMEERSDRMGVEQEGEAAGTYARALESIYRASLIPAVMRGKKRHVHPDLYDRLVAAGVTPDYPRPEPPPRVFLGSVPGMFLFAAGVWAFLTGMVPDRREAYALSTRAGVLLERGDPDPAIDLYRRAADLDPETPHHSAGLSQALARAGRLDEAEAAFRAAEALHRKSEADGGSRSWLADPDADREFRAALESTRTYIRRLRERSAPR